MAEKMEQIYKIEGLVIGNEAPPECMNPKLSLTTRSATLPSECVCMCGGVCV